MKNIKCLREPLYFTKMLLVFRSGVDPLIPFNSLQLSVIVVIRDHCQRQKTGYTEWDG